MDELNAAWRAGNDAGEGFADDGLRSGDTPRWQVLLVDSTGWAVKMEVG